VVLVLLLLVQTVLAYETDQLTFRERALADSTPQANAIMDELLRIAVSQANERTACQGSDLDFHYELAEQVHAVTSRATGVWERGAFRAPGFTSFSATLERWDAVEKFDFRHREDIYGGLTLWQSVVLTLAGPCSTFEVAGVRLGSDKFDHFLDVGFHYLRALRRKGSVGTAIEHGTGTERNIYGMLTSKTFSYADLRANYDGYLFYLQLLGEDSVVQRGSDGCAEQVRSFDWREWVHPEWDEVINPPVYTRLVERGVLRELQERREAVCSAYRWWGPMKTPEGLFLYVAGPAPAPRDPWQLEALCAPERTEPLLPSPVRPRQEVRAQRRAKPSSTAGL
jgi:hypothetical protein